MCSKKINLILMTLAGLFFSLWVIEPLLAQSEVSFLARREYAGSSGSATAVGPIAVGDFNNDGIWDLAAIFASEQGGQWTAILLGNGDGTFELAGSIPVSEHVADIVVGDFNGDSQLDLAVVGDVRVAVSLGDGTGMFGPFTTVSSIHGHTLVVEDFNVDGFQDLAVVSSAFPPGIGILLGNGDGTFRPPIFITQPQINGQLAVDDFNRDGIPDLAATSVMGSPPQYRTTILLGNGDGTFEAGETYAVGRGGPVAKGDFNRDGFLDLAVTGRVLLGNGDGTFQVGAAFEGGGNSIVVGDFDGDNNQDLALDGQRIMLGNGNGTFRTTQIIAGIEPVPARAVVADFNNDGRMDLAVTNIFVAILLGNGDGTVRNTPAVEVGDGVSPRFVAVADFNRDGLPDLAVASGLHHVSILDGNGNGTFQPARTFAIAGAPAGIFVADFNHDNRPDLAVPILDSTMAVILLGNGDGTFRSERLVQLGGPYSAFAVGDFNGDNWPDLAVVRPTGRLSILLNNRDDTFRTLPDRPVPGVPYLIIVGDFNGDSRLDLAVASDNPPGVSILLGNGDGTFGTPITTPLGPGIRSIVVGDFNGDNRLDLAVSDLGRFQSAVLILLGNGDGTFQPPQASRVSKRFGSMVVGDFNSDGRLDVALVHGSPQAPQLNSVSVLLGNGNGTLRPPEFFGTGRHPSVAAVGDFNRDARPDLVVVNTLSTRLSILMNNTPPLSGIQPPDE